MASKTRKVSREGEGEPSPTRRVTLIAPIADAVEEVVATGDFTNWARDGVRLKRRRDGAWSATLELRPGEYEYRLIVDGEWRNNPGAERHTVNPFGTENDVLIVN